ncbi:heparinase II/III family protein [Cupriavidus basilensis]
MIVSRTIFRLGIGNVFRVALHRAVLRIGGGDSNKSFGHFIQGDYFFASKDRADQDDELGPNHGVIVYFGWYRRYILDVPDWHLNPFSGKRGKGGLVNWQKIPDFDRELGDIKAVWEASRFDWVVRFARQAASGNIEKLKTLDTWLLSWCARNPPYKGENWKCGQEASIRIMNLAVGALALHEEKRPSAALIQFVKVHLARVASTLSYAIAQDNNHGTSEAAALFIGGTWLLNSGSDIGLRYQRIGRRWLENRANRLLSSDGSFSQHSVVYHRMVLDTYALVEVWRREFRLPSFSKELYGKLEAAAKWLYQMTQMECGDAPNFGANDGTNLLSSFSSDYRDFRPSVQLACALFCNAMAFPFEGECGEILKFFRVPSPAKEMGKQESIFFDSGGYGLLRRGRSFALFNIPNFRFRPSQADALNVDLWVGEDNVLRDAGTFGYNVNDGAAEYFGGTAGHNTIQFDDRDQMPRLGRFLFGEWIRAVDVNGVEDRGAFDSCSAGYRDWRRSRHNRVVKLWADHLEVEDKVDGFERRAVLRWRLRPGTWAVDGNRVFDGEHSLTVESNVPIVRFSLVSGWESRYYLKRESIPVLEVEVNKPAILTTIYWFGP